MPELPHIDEHAVEVGAPVEAVWQALGRPLSRGFSGSGRRMVGRLLGVRPLESEGDPLEQGSTIVGFRVARAVRPAELALEGQHRFSRYALIFRIDPLGPGRSRLRAETRAEFPGSKGRVYRALVIGTRGHVVVVRRLLEGARQRAERAIPTAAPARAETSS